MQTKCKPTPNKKAIQLLEWLDFTTVGPEGLEPSTF